MDIVCSFMEDAGVNREILTKFDCNQGDYVKKAETVTIADKLEKLLNKNSVFVYSAGRLVARTESLLKNITKENRLTGWAGSERKDATIIKKDDELWKEIEGFIKFCRESRGFWVW